MRWKLIECRNINGYARYDKQVISDASDKRAQRAGPFPNSDCAILFTQRTPRIESILGTEFFYAINRQQPAPLLSEACDILGVGRHSPETHYVMIFEFATFIKECGYGRIASHFKFYFPAFFSARSFAHRALVALPILALAAADILWPFLGPGFELWRSRPLNAAIACRSCDSLFSSFDASSCNAFTIFIHVS